MEVSEMKTTNKLYAAGGGLLVAALIGFSPALADDNTTAALQDGSLSPIEMTMDETPATSTYTVDGVDQAKDAAAEETTPATDEATAQQKAKATETPAETAEKSSPEAPAPGVYVSPEPNTDAVLEGHVKGYVGETPYMKAGGSLWLIGGLSIIAIALFLIRKKAD